MPKGVYNKKNSPQRVVADGLIKKAILKGQSTKDIFDLLKKHPDLKVDGKWPSRSIIYGWIKSVNEGADLVDKDLLDSISDHPLEDKRKAQSTRLQAMIRRCMVRREELVNRIEKLEKEPNPDQEKIDALYIEIDAQDKKQLSIEEKLSHIESTWDTPLEQSLSDPKFQQTVFNALKTSLPHWGLDLCWEVAEMFGEEHKRKLDIATKKAKKEGKPIVEVDITKGKDWL